MRFDDGGCFVGEMSSLVRPSLLFAELVGVVVIVEDESSWYCVTVSGGFRIGLGIFER